MRKRFTQRSVYLSAISVGVLVFALLIGGQMLSRVGKPKKTQTTSTSTTPSTPPQTLAASPSTPPEPSPTPSPSTPTKGVGTKPSTKPKAKKRTDVGPYGSRKMTGSKSVALTFDDGPHAEWTPKILDLLRKHDVKATFCLVGTEVRRHPELVVRIVREGHTLCNHSWRHDFDLGTRSREKIRADMARTNAEIRRAVPGAQIRYFRHPGGSWTANAVKVARDLGMISLDWDVDPQDWRRPGASTIAKRVTNSVRPGSIVLLHDGGGDRRGTLGACSAMLGSLKSRYQLTRLPDLA